MSLQFTGSAEGVEVRVGREELAVLEALPGLLAGVGEIDDDPAARRLFPAAYGDDADEREFRRFAGGEIERGLDSDRQIAADVIARLGKGSATVTPAEAEGFVRAIGSARLTIAARHGLLSLEELPPPGSPQETIVGFLAIIQDELVQVLLDLEDAGS